MSTDRLSELAASPVFLVALVVAFVVAATPITIVVMRLVTRARRRMVGRRADELARVGEPQVSMIVAGDVADYREFAVGATLMDLSQRSAVELSHRRTGGIHGSHGSIPYVHETLSLDPPMGLSGERVVK